MTTKKFIIGLLFLFVFLLPLVIAQTEVPKAPTLERGEFSETELAIYWTNSNTTVTNFKVYREDTSSKEKVVFNINDPTATSYIDNTAEQDKIYDYWVTAVNANGESQPSDKVVNMKLKEHVEITAVREEPDEPINFTAEKVGAHYIKFIWDAPNPVAMSKDVPTIISVDFYQVGCTTNPNSVTSGVGITNKTMFIYAGLEPETTYYCQAFACHILADKSVACSGSFAGGSMNATTLKETEEQPLMITEEIAKEIVTTSGDMTSGKEPVLNEEQVTSVSIKQTTPVVIGTKTCKALGFIPIKTKIKVKIDPNTLKQKVSKPFWVSC